MHRGAGARDRAAAPPPGRVSCQPELQHTGRAVSSQRAASHSGIFILFFVSFWERLVLTLTSEPEAFRPHGICHTRT